MKSIFIIYFFIIITLLNLTYAQNSHNFPSAINEIVIEKLELRNAPIGDVLRLVASRYGMNIFVDPKVDQPISIYLQNASLVDILNYLSDEYHLDYDITGDIIKVNPPPETLPPFFINYNQSDSTLDINISNAPFGIILDSLSIKVQHTLLYNGKLVSTPLKVNLVNVKYPEDLVLFFNSMNLEVEQNSNISILKDVEPGIKLSQRKANKRKFNIDPDGKITISVANEPIAGLINQVAKKLEQNIVIYNTPPGNISLNITALNFDDFLNLILNGTGYTFRHKDDVYIVGDQNIYGIQSNHVIKLNHLKVEGIAEKIPKYLTRNAELTEIKELNSLSVVAYSNVLKDIKDYIKEIDQEIPQVLIEAIVVDFDVSNQYELGLEGGLSDKPIQDTVGVYKMMPGVDIMFKGKINQGLLDDVMGMFGDVIKITKLPDNFYLQLKALESIGKANVISKPHIATLNGHEAELKIGLTQYYKLKTNNYYGGVYPQQPANQQTGSPYYPSETERFEKIEAIVSLKLTPWITNGDEITVEIHPDFQTPVTDLNPFVPPTIQSRTLNSTVRLKNGETIILGGLIQEIESERTEQVPILGDIPLLGALFRSTSKLKQKKEMVIYITPHLYQEKQDGLDAYTDIRFTD